MPPEVVLHRQWCQVVSIALPIATVCSPVRSTRETCGPSARSHTCSCTSCSPAHARHCTNTRLHATSHATACTIWLCSLRLSFTRYGTKLAPPPPIASQVRQHPVRGQHVEHSANAARSSRKDRREPVQPRHAARGHGELEHASQPYVTR